MEEKRINAIIQARMGSTRLPGKVLMDIEGRPILEHIIQRLRAVKCVDNVIVATSMKSDDDAICRFCEENSIPCVRGSEDNVLERFGIAASDYPADIYIRATGDNPMIDVSLINDMVAFFVEKNLTYTCYKGYPIGSGVELFTHKAFSEALENADIPYELEHVAPYMYQRMKNRRVEYYQSDVDESKIRMTVDTESDFKFAQEMFSRLYRKNQFFGIEDIKRVILEEPELIAINSDVHQKILGE